MIGDSEVGSLRKAEPTIIVAEPMAECKRSAADTGVELVPRKNVHELREDQLR
jgi:hypothetical protein